MATNHDGSLIASGSWDRTARIWDWATGKDLYGTYFYWNGSTETAFSVTPSDENQPNRCRTAAQNTAADASPPSATGRIPSASDALIAAPSRVDASA